MEIELILRWLHVIGASVLLGTGAGIAFFMLMAHRTGDPIIITHTAGIVVIADVIFTASAVILQPVTGVLLALHLGWSLAEGWIVASIALYILVGLFWLPVVRWQMMMRDMARQALAVGEPLPAAYHRLFKRWFAFGIPAFACVLAIVWLMLARPELSI